MESKKKFYKRISRLGFLYTENEKIFKQRWQWEHDEVDADSIDWNDWEEIEEDDYLTTSVYMDYRYD